MNTWTEGEPLPAVLLVDEVARYFRCDPKTILRRIHDKSLRPVRGMRPYRVTVTELRRYERGE